MSDFVIDSPRASRADLRGTIALDGSLSRRLPHRESPAPISPLLRARNSSRYASRHRQDPGPLHNGATSQAADDANGRFSPSRTMYCTVYAVLHWLTSSEPLLVRSMHT